MSKTFIIGGLAVVILSSWFIFSNKEKVNDKAMVKNEDMAMSDKANEEAMMKVNDEAVMQKDAIKDKEAMMKVGAYETYAPEKILKAATGKVVLFFRASWCPTCRAIDSDIKANLAKISPGLTILDVDYDNSKDLKKKYGVTYQHTFVQVDKDGNLIKKWSGSPTLSVLISEVK